jgi:hypothetical protein
MEKSSLDAIKAQMTETKKLQQQSLKRLKEIKSKGGESMEPAQLKEINKTIRAVEKSLKLYEDL